MAIQNINDYQGDAALGYTGGMLGVPEYNKANDAFQRLQLSNMARNKVLYDQLQEKFKEAKEAAKADTFDLAEVDPKDREAILQDMNEYFEWRKNNMDSYDFTANPEKYLEGERLRNKFKSGIENSRGNATLTRKIAEQKTITPEYETEIDAHLGEVYKQPYSTRNVDPYVPAITYNVDTIAASVTPEAEELETSISKGDYVTTTKVKETPLEKFFSNAELKSQQIVGRDYAERQKYYNDYLKSPQSFDDEIMAANALIEDYNQRTKKNVPQFPTNRALNMTEAVALAGITKNYSKQQPEQDKDYTGAAYNYARLAADKEAAKAQAKQGADFGAIVDGALYLNQPLEGNPLATQGGNMTTPVGALKFGLNNNVDGELSYLNGWVMSTGTTTDLEGKQVESTKTIDRIAVKNGERYVVFKEDISPSGQYELKKDQKVSNIVQDLIYPAMVGTFGKEKANEYIEKVRDNIIERNAQGALGITGNEPLSGAPEVKAYTFEELKKIDPRITVDDVKDWLGKDGKYHPPTK